MFKHFAKMSKFSLTVDGTEVSYILYNKSTNHLDLYETITEKGFEGKGYATQLAQKTFEDCQSNGVKVKLSCSFLEHIYKKSQSQYENLLS